MHKNSSVQVVLQLYLFGARRFASLYNKVQDDLLVCTVQLYKLSVISFFCVLRPIQAGATSFTVIRKRFKFCIHKNSLVQVVLQIYLFGARRFVLLYNKVQDGLFVCTVQLYKLSVISFFCVLHISLSFQLSIQLMTYLLLKETVLSSIFVYAINSSKYV